MPNRLIIILILTGALIGLSLYFSPGATITQAADNDWLLAWSSNAYVPLDYAGRALPARGSAVKVMVLPTKNPAQNPDALYYRWLLDGEPVSRSGGQGRSSFIFTATKWGGDRHEVEAQILDSRGNALWRGSLSLKVASPQVLLKTPAGYYALTDSAPGTTGKDLELTAQPFFFQAQKPSDLLFNWSIDGQALTSPNEKNPDQLTIKVPKANLSEAIFKDLSLFVKNKADELQQLTVNIIIEIK